MKAIRNQRSCLMLFCLLMQASELMVLLHVYTDARYHSACRGGDDDGPEGSDASKCPICRQMMITSGTYLLEPAAMVQHLVEILWDEIVPSDRCEFACYGDSFLPRGPPAT